MEKTNLNNDYETIGKILDRFEEHQALPNERINHIMDIESAQKVFNIDLDAWLAADDFNFIHDFVGIYNNVDREAGIINPKFDNFFVPRFSRTGEDD